MKNETTEGTKATMMHRFTILMVASIVGFLLSLEARAQPPAAYGAGTSDFVIINGVMVHLSGDDDIRAVGVVARDRAILNIGEISVSASAEAEPSDGLEPSTANANAIGITRSRSYYNHHTDYDPNHGLAEIGIVAQGYGGHHRRDSSREIINTGTITATASSQANASSAPTPTITNATATGIAGDDNNDVITNTGTIDVDATAKTEAVDVTLEIVDTQADVSREAMAFAEGIVGDRGNDRITNTGTIDVTADATVNNKDFGLAMIGGAANLSTGSEATSHAVGVDGGRGNDVIDNFGPTSVTANATVSSDVVSIDLLSALQGESVRAPLEADAQAYGLVGGRDKDTINNTAALTVTANATADALEVELSAADLSSGGTSTTANATSVGIDGGKGKDRITNTGTMTITSNAESSSDKASVTLLTVVPADRLGPTVDSSISSTADTTGIATGSGKDDIINSGSLTAIANAKTRTFDFSWRANKISDPADVQEFPDFFNEPLIEAGTTADAHARAIDSGSDNDSILNSDTVTANASADVSTLSVFVATPVPKRLQLPVLGWAPSVFVGKLATESSSSATGVNTHDGHDSVINAGTISANALSKSRTNSWLVTLKPDLSGDDDDGSDLIPPYSLGAGMVDIGAGADATAAGVDTGDGDDLVVNTQLISANATADVAANSVTVDLEQASTRYSVNVSLIRASTEAKADVTGIATGSGNDDIVNEGDVLAESLADTNSNVVVVDAQMLKDTTVALGAQLLNANTEANANSEGVNTGTGYDVVENNSAITARAEANADAVGVDVAVRAQTATEDFAIIGQGAWVSTDTVGTANAEGVVGGHHRDKIWNSGTVEADVLADANSISVAATGVGTKKGASIGIALTQAKSIGNASARGIGGGASKDEITNSGLVKSKAVSDVDAVDVAVSLTLTDKGVVLTGTAADGSTEGSATAKGITGDDGADYINNEGTVDVLADADAESVSVSVSAQGTGTGVGLGVALSRATSDGMASASGIDGGADSDTILNSGLVKSHANADVVAGSGALAGGGASKGLVIEGAAADGSTKGTSTAAGITGGYDSDYIRNEGTVDVLADAKATSVSVSASAQVVGTGVGLGVALSRATSEAEANSTGISGGIDSDNIRSSGLVKSHAKADVVSGSGALAIGFVGKGVDLKGAAADGSTKGTSTATGISGDGGEDYIHSEGIVDVLADAKATSVSVAVAASGAGTGVTLGVALSRATSEAAADSTGISGGADRDKIINSGLLKSHAKSDVDAVDVSVGVGVVGQGLSLSGTVADSSISSSANATGLRAGAGDDYLLNKDKGDITLEQVKADADAVSVGVTLNGAIQGGVAGGVALGDASITADATALGMEGGTGNDWIINKGDITVNGVESNTDATSVSVQLGVTTAGLAIGGSLADTSATARTVAKGIDGGGGDDHLINEGDIALQQVRADADAVSVGVTLNAAIQGGVAGGVSLTDGSGRADLVAVGVDGGAGDDILVNTGTIKAENVEADAHATGVSVSLQASMAGIAGGAALADTSGTSQSVVKGLAGEAGDDKLYNAGVIDLSGKSKTDALSVAINISGAVGVAGGAEITDASTMADTLVMGIDGGHGRDDIANEGTVGVNAESDAESATISLGISVGVGGNATLADARSTAAATAIGINTGTGRQHKKDYKRYKDHGSKKKHRHKKRITVLTNDGAVTAVAKSNTVGTSIAGNLLGFALGETTNTAKAHATGIRTEEGREKIYNEGIVTANSDATAKGLSVSVTLGGKAMGDASTTADAIATGIDSGDRNDQIENLAAINVDARSNASAKVVSVGLIGVSEADASITSIATAVGINSGDGRDKIKNRSSITVLAGDPTVTDVTTSCTPVAGGACAQSSNVSVNLAGVGTVNASTTANAVATGIVGGEDDDYVDSRDGTIDVAARAKTAASGVNVGVFGAALSEVKTTAASQATGISGDSGNDDIVTGSIINAGASSDIVISGTGFSFAGAGGFDATLNGRAAAAAITGGSGKDYIRNEGSLTAIAVANLRSSTDSNVVFGASSADTESGAFTDAVGIDGGDDDDYVRNKANITSASTAGLTVSDSSFNFGGAGGAQGSLTASTRSAGIATGDGKDVIKNEGILDVDATSTLSSSGDSDVVFGASSSGGTSGAITDAVGIDGGDDDDYLWNSAKVDVDSRATLSMNNASFNFGGAGGTEGTLSATTRSVGLAGGSGNDDIGNEGEIFVDAKSTLTSTGGSDVAFGRSGATASSGAFTESIGIDGGVGDDYIWNKAKIDARSTANLTLSGSSYTFGGTGDVSGKLTAGTRSIGIHGGSGRDVIRNDADIVVDARSNLQSRGRVNTTFGTSASDALVTTDTTATGIDGGDGDDIIDNVAKIMVTTGATANSLSSAYVFGGSSSTEATVKAFSHSIGLAGGKGNDRIYNKGVIDIDTSSSTTQEGSAHAEFGGSSASGLVTSDALAVGIDGGDGNDVVINQGSINVKGLTFTDSEHRTNTGFLFGDGDSVAKATTRVSGYGIDVGAGDNEVVNETTISVELSAFANTETDSDGADIFDGDAFSRSDSIASGTAIGIRAGHGNNMVTNNGSIIAKTSRKFEILGLTIDLPVRTLSDAFADGDGIDGDGTARSFATTTAWAAGVWTGNGNNDITNNGAITVEARGAATALAGADSDAGGSTRISRVPKVNAHGFGIHAGNGNNHIVNHGIINVTTRGNNNKGVSDISARAVGIRTGDGNDEVFNFGTITTTEIENSSTSSGTAIDVGAGNDMVRLGDGSVTNGNIDLGSGSDTLSLEGTPVINGTIFDALSTVSLVFNNSGSFHNGLPGVTAIKNGHGTFTLSMLNQMERLEVNHGTLKLTSDYEFLENGLFQAKVHGDGTQGQFFVDGEAGLNGKMKVVRGSEAYRDGTTFNVLEASNGIQNGTAFTGVELPNTRLVKFSAKQLDDTVQVETSVEPFRSVAENANRVSGTVANHLDQVLPSATGELSEMLGTLQGLSESEFAAAFTSLSPDSFDNFTTTTLTMTRRYVGGAHNRMANMRAGAGADTFLPGTLGYRGRPADEPRYGGWLVGFGHDGDQEAHSAGFRGFDYSTIGAMAGFDYPLRERLIGGVSFGSASTDLDLDGGRGDGDIDGLFASVYGTYFLGESGYIESVLSVGQQDYGNARIVDLGATQSTARSTHDGKVFSAFVEAGKALAAGAWRSELFGSLHYVSLDEDGFTESGAGGANLIVDDRRTESVVAELGWRSARRVKTRRGVLIPQFSLALLYDFDVDERDIAASFTGAPGSVFVLEGRDLENNGLRLGGGLHFLGRKALTVSGRLDAEIRDDFEDVAAQLQVQRQF